MRLKIPTDFDIRPTQDRVKESIFNVISDNIVDSSVLDLFSGSGSLGIESISRGAKVVYFVDISTKAINLIKANINLLKNIDASYKIVQKDAARFIKDFNERIFNIVFLDPPYKISSSDMRNIFRNLSQSPAVDINTIIIYEYFFKRFVENEFIDFKIIKISHFGDKTVTYLML